MIHLMIKQFSILFLLGLFSTVMSCATLKQDDNLQLENDRASEEEIKKDGISRSIDQKITSIDELTEYLGMVSPQSEEFKEAYQEYLDDRKDIIRANSNTSKATSILQERETGFLESMNNYMSMDQYNRYVAYLNSQKKQESKVKSF